MSQENIASDKLRLAAEIVSAYVTKNALPAAELPAVIASVHAALNKAAGAITAADSEQREPAVPIKKSITPDYLICLDDGKKFKALRRHLRASYNLSPEQYRQRWGLPADYPMVAPNYA